MGVLPSSNKIRENNYYVVSSERNRLKTNLDSGVLKIETFSVFRHTLSPTNVVHRSSRSVGTSIKIFIVPFGSSCFRRSTRH